MPVAKLVESFWNMLCPFSLVLEPLELRMVLVFVAYVKHVRVLIEAIVPMKESTVF